MLLTIIHDRKFGNVKMVCSVFLYRFILSSLSMSASTIGAGKHTTNSTTLIQIVIQNAFEKVGEAKTDVKFFMPVHGLAQIPSLPL